LTPWAAAEQLLESIAGSHRGKAIGFTLGWCAGWFGASIGLVLGAMMDALLVQRNKDRAIDAYLQNPGPSAFAESVPGSAAFCALAVLTAARNLNGGDAASLEAAALSRIERIAAGVFGEGAFAELETYARAAASRADALNPDLLAESLCARAGNAAGGIRLREAACAALEGLAESERAKRLAESVREILSPGKPPTAETDRTDPYAVLGLERGAPLDEVKAVYRRLAVQFHPDAAAALTEEQRKSAAEAFIRIDGAYRRIAGRD